jgi:hypothetical protein
VIARSHQPQRTRHAREALRQVAQITYRLPASTRQPRPGAVAAVSAQPPPPNLELAAVGLGDTPPFHRLPDPQSCARPRQSITLNNALRAALEFVTPVLTYNLTLYSVGGLHPLVLRGPTSERSRSRFMIHYLTHYLQTRRGPFCPASSTSPGFTGAAEAHPVILCDSVEYKKRRAFLNAASQPSSKTDFVDEFRICGARQPWPLSV